MLEKMRENLRIQRMMRGYTQRELAERLGLSPRTIRAYESGASTPSRDALCKMADFFHVGLDELMGRDGQRDV